MCRNTYTHARALHLSLHEDAKRVVENIERKKKVNNNKKKRRSSYSFEDNRTATRLLFSMITGPNRARMESDGPRAPPPLPRRTWSLPVFGRTRAPPHAPRPMGTDIRFCCVRGAPSRTLSSPRIHFISFFFPSPYDPNDPVLRLRVRVRTAHSHTVVNASESSACGHQIKVPFDGVYTGDVKPVKYGRGGCGNNNHRPLARYVFDGHPIPECCADEAKTRLEQYFFNVRFSRHRSPGTIELVSRHRREHAKNGFSPALGHRR